jgi:hypothetical protein
LVAARNSRSGGPSNAEPMSSRSSLMFLSVNGTAGSYGQPCVALTTGPVERTSHFRRKRQLTKIGVGHRCSLAAADARTAPTPSRVTIDSVADELVASMESRVAAGQTAAWASVRECHPNGRSKRGRIWI